MAVDNATVATLKTIRAAAAKATTVTQLRDAVTQALDLLIAAAGITVTPPPQ